jgi:hypothetical protein
MPFFLLKEAFSPNRLPLTILMAIVSVTLIGPVEEYVFESWIAAPVGPATADVHGHGPIESRFERMVQIASPRAFGRLLLVLLFWLLVTGLHGVLEATFHSSDTVESLIIVLGNVTPAVVTHFWCAALRRRVKCVACRAGWASMVAGILLIGLPAMLLVIAPFARIAVSIDAGHPFELLIYLGKLLLVLILGAPLPGWVFLAAFSYVGGMAIDMARRRKFSSVGTVALLAVALCAVNAVIWLGLVRWLSALYHVEPAELMRTLNAGIVLSPLGWALGLLLSGFPSVLQASSRVETDSQPLPD